MTEAQKCLYHIAENMRMDKSISKEGYEYFQQAIKALEQKPRKGKWISKPHVYGVTYCSECNFELKIDDTNYCPNCGAKMEKRFEEVEE